MQYNRVSEELIAEIRATLPGCYVESADLEPYGRDETEDLLYLPELVVLPESPEQISAVLKIAEKHNVPVTPRGAGTGLSGGALPLYGGIVLGTSKLNKILWIDEENMQACVEPGVINQVFQDAVKEKGLFYPPDPASRGSCFLGGNLAECSGGPKAVKYGVTRDYVLNMEVVLPGGDIIWTGANVLKNSTGYNLTHLMMGSEGTLGVITKIIFKLIPHPTHNLLMLVPFASAEKACECVAKIFRLGVVPSGLEFMERDAIDWAMKYIETGLKVEDSTQAHLLIEVDGFDPELLMKDCEKISEMLYAEGCSEIYFAETAQQKADLWKLRRGVAEAVKSHSVYKEEDTVVPRAALPALLKGVKDIGKKYGFRSVCYGHAGDGNLHVNIIKGELDEKSWNDKVPLGIREIFTLCKELGGTISGEHGIGLVQKSYLDIVLSQRSIELQKGIKKLFDPKEILNPGKIFM